MRKSTIAILCLSFAVALLIVPETNAGIARVAKRYNMLNFYGGYATPYGEYDEVGRIRFVDQQNRPVDLDADELYDATYFFGIDYGTLYGRHFLYQIGFRYTEHNLQDWLEEEIANEFSLRQYDIELNTNYMFLSLVDGFWSPYVGAGVAAGFTSYSEEGFDDESELKMALSVNFGADIKLYQDSNGRSFVTLASMNNYNLVASDDRPKYLNIGVAIRYFFR